MRDSSSEASTIETFVLAKIMYHLLNNNKGIIATLIVNKRVLMTVFSGGLNISESTKEGTANYDSISFLPFRRSAKCTFGTRNFLSCQHSPGIHNRIINDVI